MSLLLNVWLLFNTGFTHLSRNLNCKRIKSYYSNFRSHTSLIIVLTSEKLNSSLSPFPVQHLVPEIDRHTSITQVSCLAQDKWISSKTWILFVRIIYFVGSRSTSFIELIVLPRLNIVHYIPCIVCRIVSINQLAVTLIPVGGNSKFKVDILTRSQ